MEKSINSNHSCYQHPLTDKDMEAQRLSKPPEGTQLEDGAGLQTWASGSTRTQQP